MTVLITLTTAGADTGPFDLFSDSDGYTSAFEVGITKAFLLFGFPSSNVPDDATNIMIKSQSGLCLNYIIVPIPTTTTTTTVAPTTTTTTTTAAVTTTTTTTVP